MLVQDLLKPAFIERVLRQWQAFEGPDRSAGDHDGSDICPLFHLRLHLNPDRL